MQLINWTVQTFKDAAFVYQKTNLDEANDPAAVLDPVLVVRVPALALVDLPNHVLDRVPDRVPSRPAMEMAKHEASLVHSHPWTSRTIVQNRALVLDHVRFPKGEETLDHHRLPNARHHLIVVLVRDLFVALTLPAVTTLHVNLIVVLNLENALDPGLDRDPLPAAILAPDRFPRKMTTTEWTIRSSRGQRAQI